MINYITNSKAHMWSNVQDMYLNLFIRHIWYTDHMIHHVINIPPKFSSCLQIVSTAKQYLFLIFVRRHFKLAKATGCTKCRYLICLKTWLIFCENYKKHVESIFFYTFYFSLFKFVKMIQLKWITLHIWTSIILIMFITQYLAGNLTFCTRICLNMPHFLGCLKDSNWNIL